MQDIDDSRAQGLVHLIKLLPKLEHPPKYMFLENVKNFEVNIGPSSYLSNPFTFLLVGIAIKSLVGGRAIPNGLRDQGMLAITTAIWHTQSSSPLLHDGTSYLSREARVHQSIIYPVAFYNE